ncbi:MAG: TIGR01777 family oxidoreductase [Bacteroidales bacterium]
MRISISGSTGFIGSELSAFFSGLGYEVVALRREDFAKGVNHLATKTEGSQFIINLAGAPIIGRWTRSYSRKLWHSRIDTTRMLKEAIATMQIRPKAFISASAVGFYSQEGVHTEEQFAQDPEFLGTLCQSWEEEAQKAAVFCSVYIIRIGIVLGERGGALPQMALPFRLGVGGKIGTGKQMISWIHLSDLLSALQWIIEKEPESQVFNLTAPNPVSNAAFSSALARTLRRPNFLPVPSFALRLLYGEGAVVLLSGQHVLPHNLLKEGFSFRFEKVEDALQDLLAK